MKTPREIRHKIKQARYRHLKRAIRKGLSRKPCNCFFNRSVRPPNQPNLGVCMKGAQDLSTWKGVVCDEAHGGLGKASDCPFFKERRTKEEITAKFEDFLEGATFVEVAERYPDMAALMWVLKESEQETNEEDNED